MVNFPPSHLRRFLPDMVVILAASPGGSASPSLVAAWLSASMIWCSEGAATRMHMHLLRTGSMTCTEVCRGVEGGGWRRKKSHAHMLAHNTLPPVAQLSPPHFADVAAAHDKAACRGVLLHRPSEGLLGLLAQSINLIEHQNLESLLAWGRGGGWE